ncbi:hypothetical protein SE17_03310 [Kouleothrix aurantiaca]|uniref:Carboxypeptidase regulatory-like domain-containing protein n=1 Tax=Kouleothrix aurantiaca TaxID=186479 RepID=A0A0P9D617_9CHLR|nr:hypothetical protein SE17_03310 [Kouleothrix aurantiaca]
MRVITRAYLVLVVVAFCWLPLHQNANQAQAADIGQITTLGVANLGGPVSALSSQADHIYAGVNGRLVIVGVADPAQPTQLGQLMLPAKNNTPLTIESIAADGTTVYLATSTSPAGSCGWACGGVGALWAVNVQNPASPALLSSYTYPSGDLGSAFRSVALAGTGVFVSAEISLASTLQPYRSELLAFDRSNPSSLKRVGSASLFGASNLTISNQVGYIAGRDDYLTTANQQLFAYNASTPKQLSRLGAGLPGLPTNSVTLLAAGARVYIVADSAAGVTVRVADTSTPAHPVLLGSATFAAPLTSASAGRPAAVLDGQHLIIQRGDRSMFHIVDVTTPGAMLEIGRTQLAADSLVLNGALASVPNHLFAAANGSQLFVMRYDGLSIIGTVTHADGFSPVAGVTIARSSGASASTNAQGRFSFIELAPGTYILTPTLALNHFWPAQRTLTLPPDGAVRFVMLAAPANKSFTPGTSTQLTYTDTKGSTTTFDVPENAFARPATIAVTPTVALNPTLAFTGHAFELTSSQAFTAPISVTITYVTSDFRVVSDVSQLTLYYWSGAEWVDTGSMCSSATPYIRDLALNTLKTTVCKTGLYALFGPTHRSLIPITASN